MSENTVDIAVRWSEQGQEVPNRVRQHLQEMPATADRLGLAFQRFENRQPTMVVRRTASALEEMGASAFGAAGRWGMLAGSIAFLAPEVALGVTAIALAIRAFTQDIRDNDKAQADLIARLQQLGTHGRIRAESMKISDLRDQLDHPSFWRRAWTTIKGVAQEGPFEGPADAEVNRRQALGRRIEGLQMEQGIDTRAFESPQNKARRDAALKLQQAQARLELSGLPAGAEMGAPATAVNERLETLRLMLNDKLPRAVAVAVAAVHRHAEELDINTAALDAAREASAEAEIRNRMLASSEEQVTAAIQTRRNVIKGMTPEVAKQTAETTAAANASIKWAETLRTQLPGAIASLATGPAGAVQALSHILAAGKGVSPLTAGAIELGGNLLTRLFQTKPQQVVITAYEAEALRQIKELRGDPATTQIIVIGGDVRSLQQQLGRLGRAGAITRFP